MQLLMSAGGDNALKYASVAVAPPERFAIVDHGKQGPHIICHEPKTARPHTLSLSLSHMLQYASVAVAPPERFAIVDHGKQGL